MIPLLRSARAVHRLDGCSHRLRYEQIDSALPTYPIRHFVSTENAGRGYTRAIGGKSYVERVLRVRLLQSIAARMRILTSNTPFGNFSCPHRALPIFLSIPVKEDVYALYCEDVQGAPLLRAGAQ